MSTQTLAPSASVFESFNARSLAPEQVAKTFVPSPAFFDLASRSHATVIGPRGSGKTSLLKMLQPRALETWSTAGGEHFRSKIDYTGVFVPTDISWNRQTSAIVEGLPKNLVQLFRGAAFTTHVLHELLETFCWRIEPLSTNKVSFRRVKITSEAHRAIARHLASAWSLSPSTETLIGVKHALSARQGDIWNLAQRISLLKEDSKVLPGWLANDLLSQCGHAIEVFDDLVGEPQARWALLFDELELAPEWIMSGLLTALRSTNQKLIYKLAISPFNESYESLKSAVQGVPGQDYSEIRLWYAHKEEGIEFSRRLMASVCREAGVKIKHPSELLGKSILEIGEKGARAYDRHSAQYRILKQAIQNDSSFRQYWDSQEIDLDRIDLLSENERAAKVRKIYPLVAVRDYFRSAEGTGLAAQQPTRGRKSLEIYAGASGILAISEGNPRWVIGITKALIQELAAEGAPPISREAQARLLESTIHKFRARLKTVSVAPAPARGRTNTLLGFLDQIGDYFRVSLIIEKFQPQPPLSFVVDASASEEIVTAIGRALNAGALVYVPDKASIGLLNDVRGKRFRLSYLLAPNYSLPLRLGDSIALSRIFKDATDGGQRELGFEQTPDED